MLPIPVPRLAPIPSVSYLILCANRDEFLARPTLPAALHSFGADDAAGRVLSGRDALAGGTWLGLAPASGRVALLTNITEPPQSLPSSRGALAAAFLLAPPAAPLDDLFPPAAEYAGFNLLLLAPAWSGGALSFPADSAPADTLEHGGAALLTNGGARKPLHARALSPAERAGGGQSNGVDGAGAEAWPKVVEGRALFAAAVAAAPPPPDDAAEEDTETRDAALASRLFALLRTTAPAPVRAREELRRTVCVAPLAVPLGGAGEAGVYATRVATVLLVRRDGAARFAERDVWVAGGGEGGGEAGTGTGAVLAEPGAGERLWRLRVGAEAPGAASLLESAAGLAAGVV
ncbi:NRDE protein-domain-containing protein [Mycena belliarum]|uniref:NRDE protein-domain-containing protein n=1 Tax=Mycena belliarum TaxID=1033014 RepID=A0AAD6TS37_9AGAR|nr:NRDE protein-domain-containing protein [Mycena belliae]